ncbi:MAG: serpin family protein [Limisphaerales bacterium]
MKAKIILGLALVLGGNGGAQTEPPDGKSSDLSLAEVVAGNTGFAVDLYGQLRTNEGNVCFSPYSISTALAMTYGGARSETEKQMAQTLHFNLPADKLHPTFAALEANLMAVQKKGRVQLAEANSLWPQTGFAFQSDYLALCRKYYGTAVKPVDYVKHTEAARKTINDWVKARTNRKIVELVKPGMLDTSNHLVLVNAIYFKGNWASQFEGRFTENKPFHVSPEKTITAPLMQQSHDYRYAEFPGLQVLDLPYVDGDLSMLVLLPRQMDGLGALETELTTQNLVSWTGNLHSQKVEVFLPKFKITSGLSLADTLGAMGMSDAFIFGRADFSGMDGRKDLFVNAVAHQAFVEVNEEGTEAIAATAVSMGAGAAPPRMSVFRADHPFLFLIRDNRNGSILFLGRVMDPTQ